MQRKAVDGVMEPIVSHGAIRDRGPECLNVLLLRYISGPDKTLLELKDQPEGPEWGLPPKRTLEI